MTNQPSHILVVDDNELARLVIVRSVERQGYTISHANSGARALEMMRAEKMDLVLLDLLMPEMDGFEVLRQMKADPELNAIPVIVVTAIDERETVRKSINMGAADHITKPVNHQLLAHRIRKILTRG